MKARGRAKSLKTEDRSASPPRETVGELVRRFRAKLENAGAGDAVINYRVNRKGVEISAGGAAVKELVRVDRTVPRIPADAKVCPVRLRVRNDRLDIVVERGPDKLGGFAILKDDVVDDDYIDSLINDAVITGYEFDDEAHVVIETKEQYYRRVMVDGGQDLNALAADLGYTFETAKETLERQAGEAARETTSRATATPRPAAAAAETTKRGPRVKPNPALPKTAPEIYRDRKPREELGGRKENIVQFIERVYAPWLDILTRADLRRLDDTADKGVDRWLGKGEGLPKGLLPTEFELNTAKRLAKRSGSRLREGARATI